MKALVGKHEPMPTRSELANMARKAADAVQQRGLSKGTYSDTTGAVCHNGALALAIGSTPWDMANQGLTWRQVELFLRLDRACQSRLCREGFRDQITKGLGDVRTHAWNDLSFVTAEDVILHFKNVARELEEA